MKKYLLASALALAAVVAIAPVASASAATTKQKHKASTVRCHLEVKHGKKYVKTWTKCPKASSAASSVAGVNGKDGVNGRDGKDGAQGPQGIPGLTGKNGVSGYEVRTWRYSKDDANSDMGPGYIGVGSGAIATVACSPGKVAIGGGYRFTSAGDNGFNSKAISDGSGVVASFPGRMDWNTNTVKPNDNSGWIVQVNNKVNAADMTLYVVCVNAA
jgi:hypothetical protein